MNLTNDSYVILIGTKNFTERYYRDQTGWLKMSARGRTFRMTASRSSTTSSRAGRHQTQPDIKVEHRDVLISK